MYKNDHHHLLPNSISLNFFLQVYPEGTESNSLLDDALEIGAKSSIQLERTQNHSTPIMQARGQLEIQKQSVADLKEALNATGNRDNYINVKLIELQRESRKCKEKYVS